MKKILILLLMISTLLTSVAFAQEETNVDVLNDLEVVETLVIEDTEEHYIKQDILEDGSVVESGIISLPQITTFSYTGGSWNSGTCYSNGKGIYVYKEYGGKRIQFIADVNLVDPSCGNGSQIVRGYDITLDRKKGGYFTTTKKTQYTAYHSGFSLSLFVGNGRMWTD